MILGDSIINQKFLKSFIRPKLLLLPESFIETGISYHSLVA